MNNSGPREKNGSLPSTSQEEQGSRRVRGGGEGPGELGEGAGKSCRPGLGTAKEPQGQHSRAQSLSTVRPGEGNAGALSTAPVDNLWPLG